MLRDALTPLPATSLCRESVQLTLACSQRTQLLSCASHVLSDDVVHLYHVTFRRHVTHKLLHTNTTHLPLHRLGFSYISATDGKRKWAGTAIAHSAASMFSGHLRHCICTNVSRGLSATAEFLVHRFC